MQVVVGGARAEHRQDQCGGGLDRQAAGAPLDGDHAARQWGMRQPGGDGGVRGRRRAGSSRSRRKPRYVTAEVLEFVKAKI